MKAFGIIWLLWALLCLAANVAIVCVIIHFISKYW